MSESCIFHLDLVSKMKCEGPMLKYVVDKIREIDFDKEVIEIICAVIEINRDQKIEIYLEEAIYQENVPSEFLDLISKIENIVGGFTDGSSLKWQVEFPFSSNVWTKEGYEWALFHSEQDDYYEGDSWSDPEWDNWEE